MSLHPKKQISHYLKQILNKLEYIAIDRLNPKMNKYTLIVMEVEVQTGLSDLVIS